MTTAKTKEGEDVFDVISRRLIQLGGPITALIPHADDLPAKAEFAKFVQAWGETVSAWDAYLSADLRATLLQPEGQA